MPHARILDAFEGHPAGRILVATLEDDPAAGAEMEVTIPGRAAWEVHAIAFRFVTDATVASRRPFLLFDNGQHVFMSISPPIAQTASQNFLYSYYPDGQREPSFTEGMRQPLPPRLVLLPGWRVRTSTTNVQAGDNYAAPVLYVTEIPERGEGVWDELARAVAREIIDRRALDA